MGNLEIVTAYNLNEVLMCLNFLNSTVSKHTQSLAMNSYLMASIDFRMIFGGTNPIGIFLLPMLYE